MLPAVFLAGLAALASAAPILDTTQAPAVDIQNGTVIGQSINGVDFFSGIPYAEPPTGTLRLRPPQTLSSGFGTFTATSLPSACPQFFTQINTTELPSDVIALIADSPLGQEVLNESEDCLTINVQRPTGTTSDSNLPVLFWIFGGGFEFGWSSMYNGSDIVQKSIDLGQPIIYVAVNYRVGGFGFLAGQELAAEHSTNLGLRDQRLGLQWVQDNIAAFGGDSSKVTIWGESAGSISVCDHTIINGGDNTYNGQPLFRGAIMDSGTIVPADPVTAPQAQAIYNQVVSNSGCTGASDTLACLRALPYETFLNSVNSVPGIFNYQSLDLSYLPRPDPGDSFFPLSPEIPFANGNYARVPIIVGDQNDEGTLFALVTFNITNNDQLIDYLATYFPGNPDAVSLVTGLLENYPDDASDGAPYGTGDFYNFYPEFKRLASILGDFTFTLTRRAYLSYVSDSIDAWSYISTYLDDLPVVGTFHTSDIIATFGLLPDYIDPIDTAQTYYISFVNQLDPNALGTASPLTEWPQWSSSSGDPTLLRFKIDGTSLTDDSFRSGAYEYLSDNISGFRV